MSDPARQGNVDGLRCVTSDRFRAAGDGEPAGRHSDAPLPTIRAAIAALEGRLLARVVGGQHLVRGLITALLTDGHVLLDGAPGLAKTRGATALAEALEATFRRVAMGPGQRMGQLFGAEPFSHEARSPGQAPEPVFANILLAESIDRASAEMRLALLDAMTEREVMLEGIPARLPDVFLVCATRTLITRDADARDLAADERDRFLLNLRLGYPDQADEQRMLDLVRVERAATGGGATSEARLPLAVVLAARAGVRAVRVGPQMLRRITFLTAATRDGNAASHSPARWIRGGVGPRGSIALERCARAHAWLSGRQQITEKDLAAVAHDVLRHRIDLSDAAVSAGMALDDIITELLSVSPG